MLSTISKEMENARGPLALTDLSRRLGIERGALEGMVQFLERKGKLRRVCQAPAACDACKSQPRKNWLPPICPTPR